MGVYKQNPVSNDFQYDQNSVMAALLFDARSVSHTKSIANNTEDIAVSFAHEGIKVTIPILKFSEESSGLGKRSGVFLFPANATAEQISGALASGPLEISAKKDNQNLITLTFSHNGLKIICPFTLPHLDNDGKYVSDKWATISPENDLPEFIADYCSSYELKGQPQNSVVVLGFDHRYKDKKRTIGKALTDHFNGAGDNCHCEVVINDDSAIFTGAIEDISELFSTLAKVRPENKFHSTYKAFVAQISQYFI